MTNNIPKRIEIIAPQPHLPIDAKSPLYKTGIII